MTHEKSRVLGMCCRNRNRAQESNKLKAGRQIFLYFPALRDQRRARDGNRDSRVVQRGAHNRQPGAVRSKLGGRSHRNETKG